MVNIKQLRSDIAGPLLYQGATSVQRSTNLFYNDVSNFLSVNSTKIGTTGTESYVSGDAGTLKLKNSTDHYIDIQNNIIKYSAADHRILGKLGIGSDTEPTVELDIFGSVKISTLSGSGIQMVVTDDDGNLNTQDIPSSASLNDTYVGFGSAGDILTGSSDITWNGTIFYINGDIRITNLGGSGAQMVVADNNGILGKQDIPSSATLTETYIGFGDSNNELTGSSNLYWNGTGITFLTSRLEQDANDIYLSSTNNGTSSIHLRPSFTETVTLNTSTTSILNILKLGSAGLSGYSEGGGNYSFSLGAGSPSNSQFQTILTSGTSTYFNVSDGWNGYLSVNGSSILNWNSSSVNISQKTNITRSTIGGSIYAQNNSYNLSGDGPIQVWDGTSGGQQISLGYSSTAAMRLYWGGAAIVESTGAVELRPATKLTVYTKATTLGKLRINSATIIDATYALEVVGEAQVTSQAGTGDRIVQADSTGVQSALTELIGAWITDSTAQSLLEDTGNWDINGVFSSSPALADTYQGQQHYDANYLFVMVDDNVPIRLARV